MNAHTAQRTWRSKTKLTLLLSLWIAAGFMAAVRMARNSPLVSPMGSASLEGPPGGASAAVAPTAAALAGTDLPAGLPDLSSSATELRNEAAPITVDLPPPPSGDYELTLSAERIAALVDAKYASLFPSLGLSPAQLSRLRALLLERQQTTIDAANAALLFGLNPVRDLPEIIRGLERFQSGIDARIRDEFGNATFSAYREFDATFRERNSVADLHRVLETDREQLRPEQEARLIHLMKNSPARSFSENLASAIYGGLNERAPISDQALAAAGDLLSPRQQERLRELQARLSTETEER